MALSHDTQAQADAEIEREIEFAKATGSARALAQALVLFERNPEPMRHREAANPAHSITRIRLIRPVVAGRVNVDEATKAHNSLVANLGRP